MADTVVPLPDVFDVLAGSAKTRADDQRPFFGAQAKLDLIREFNGFSEAPYGYKKFIELLKAGRDAGHFELEMVEGHTRILPAGANLTGAPVSSAGRIQHDLWTTVVSWDTGLRFWDRKRNRAIFVPTDAAGTPLWETERDNFVSIEPISMETQLEWMDEFAREQEPASRDQLLGALSGSQPGAFKRALGELGLASGWRNRLRNRVTAHAVSWASAHSLTPSSILEQSTKRSVTVDAPVAAPAHNSQAQAVMSRTGTEVLRDRVHRVIDRMSHAELAALSIPAAYLLEG